MFYSYIMYGLISLMRIMDEPLHKRPFFLVVQTRFLQKTLHLLFYIFFWPFLGYKEKNLTEKVIGFLSLSSCICLYVFFLGKWFSIIVLLILLTITIILPGIGYLILLPTLFFSMILSFAWLICKSIFIKDSDRG